MRLSSASAVSRSSSYLDFWRATVPASWTAPDHVRAIAEHLDAVTRGEVDRLLIAMPPRHGKSESVTVRYPVLRLERAPEQNVLITGYNERFARRFGRKARGVARLRGLSLDPEKAAADEWATTAGGVCMTRGVGSPPTGVGFGLIAIDDPVRRREDAESEVYREKVWDWYTDDLYTRLEPGGAIVLVMTLWHEDDLAARAVASEPGRWTILKLPALALEDDALGRKPGEALWPERYPVEALERIRQVQTREDGERSFEALYQQNPTPREGAFFRVGRLTVSVEVPACESRVRSWDLAASPQGDWTVGVLMGRDPTGCYWVTDVVRGRWTPGEVERVVAETAARDGREVSIRLPEDPGAGGTAWAQRLVRSLAGYSVRAVRVSGRGDKALRASPLAAQIEAGNVGIARRSWTPVLVEELRSFPAGKHDDQVDALADAFDELTTSASWGDVWTT